MYNLYTIKFVLKGNFLFPMVKTVALNSRSLFRGGIFVESNNTMSLSCTSVYRPAV